MQISWARTLSFSALFVMLVGCQHSSEKSEERGAQYKDGKLSTPFVRVMTPNVTGFLSNGNDFISQIVQIGNVSPNLYGPNGKTYHAITQWLNNGAKLDNLNQFGLSVYQMSGNDGFGNVNFTGYYTPVLDAKLQPDTKFKYPLYALPARVGKNRLPTREQIYQGALANQGLEIAYSSSLIDTFLMEVQGSAYLDFSDGTALNFFAYAGKNGHAYSSIGRVLIERGEIPAEEMSMQAIKQWVATHNESEVVNLLVENASYVFFTPKGAQPVKGASGIPLIANASVAADRALIAPGTVLLAEVPVLDEQGKWSGKYQLRLMVALDVGGAIKKHHFDIYQGIGKKAGELAGFYNHFGRVWLLTTPSDAMNAKLNEMGLSY